MKLFCPSHGVHFPEEFDQTLQLDCRFWKAAGGEDLPRSWKRKIWRWNFGLDMDRLYGETNYILGVNWRLGKGDLNENWFEQNIPNYRRWGDKRRRQFQKDYFRKKLRAERIAEMQVPPLRYRLVQAYKLIIKGKT